MKIIVSTLGFIALITPAFAQSAVTKARELMKTMGIEKTLNEHMSDADDIQRSGAFLISKIVAVNPGEESKIGDLLVDEDRALLPQIIPPYVDYMAQIYAAAFTPAELDQLNAFYKNDSMQDALQQSSQSTDVPEMSSDARDQSIAFQKTPVGKKLQQKAPLIMKKVNLYAADVVREKQRDLLYAALRRDLPKNGLRVPNPFAPDTFMDKTIHDNTVKANSHPRLPVPQPTPQAAATPIEPVTQPA